MQTVTLNRNNGIVESMDLDTLSRWACLVEAFEIIQTKAKELGRNAENCLNSQHIDKYISERFPSLRHDLEVEIHLGNF